MVVERNKEVKARKRILSLLDKDSFHEVNAQNDNDESYNTNGVITGIGKIANKTVCVYSQDISNFHGTIGVEHGQKIIYLQKLALKKKCPIIGINDSGGARIQEGVCALKECGKILYYNTRLSGIIPQIMIIAGPCAGLAAYSPGIADFVFMIGGQSQMFVTGPKVIQEVTGENCTIEELGGINVHAKMTGSAHFVCEEEKSCFEQVRKLVQMIPSNMDPRKGLFKRYANKNKPPADFDFRDVVPANHKKIYDIHGVIENFTDENSFVEVSKEYAPNIVVGFGTLSNLTIGIVANQPSEMCGALDYMSSIKAARFVRYCDSYQIPIVTLVDVPGYYPGRLQEEHGIIRNGAKLIYAYAESTVPKITIILRKAFGGAFVALGSKSLGADKTYAWPDAEIAVMGPEGAVNILYGRKLKAMDEKERMGYYSYLVEEYKNNSMSAEIAISNGCVDEIIQPTLMKSIVFKDLMKLISSTPKRGVYRIHGDMPL